jgi:hypothetical protein
MALYNSRSRFLSLNKETKTESLYLRLADIKGNIVNAGFFVQARNARQQANSEIVSIWGHQYGLTLYSSSLRHNVVRLIPNIWRRSNSASGKSSKLINSYTSWS